MRSVLFSCVAVLALATVVWWALSRLDAEWAGVDETVVAGVAEKAGRPPQRPFIDTDKGDLLLFFFLTAGAAGGFVGGYCFRGLFPPSAEPHRPAEGSTVDAPVARGTEARPDETAI